MEHARPPAELLLDGGPAARSESWRKWRKLFEVFLKASGVSKEPKEIQASLLVNLIGSAGYEVYTTFTFDEGESEDDINCILKKFDNYFGARPNITVRRYKFFTRNQEEGETIDQYVTALRVLSQQCEFGDLHESLLCDRIVCGVVNNTIRDRLLRTEQLSLPRAIQICQAAEMSKEEGQCIEKSAEDMQVNAVWGQNAGSSGTVRGRGSRRRASWQRGARRGWPRQAHAAAAAAGGERTRLMPPCCNSCGSSRCTGDNQCPARYALCYICDKGGHFSRVCGQKTALRKVLNLNVDSAASDNSEEEMFYVNTIDKNNTVSKTSYEWVEEVQCNGKVIVLKIDTGSMLNVISVNEYIGLGYSINNLKSFTKRVHSFTGNRLPIMGLCNIEFVYKDKSFNLPFVVANLSCQNVLGLDSCIVLGLINRVNAINVDKYSCLFEGLGKLPGKYNIVVDRNVQPVICPTRKIPLGLKGKLLLELQRMEELGVVRKVTHPTEWVNAIVLVAKKDGNIRVCLDPRPLNRAVRRAHYSLPTVPELAAKLRGATVFSTLDARCGFWMVQIDDASADLCTFSTPFGRYQFLRLPYGISCAPEVFHAKLRQHLEDLEGVESFIDDIIVWGRTKQEHDQRLDCLMKRAMEIGIKFNREKCKFAVQEITYLGHKFDSNGMRADESKIKAIIEMPYPTDRKSLERFLGMVNYLSKFIQNYSQSVIVLRSLLKKDTEWSWDQQHAKAVDELKQKLCSAPVLALYSETAPIVLSVDASSVAVGAVLLQEGRPVEFASLTFTETQTRYAQIEKEMLAIVFAVERFRQYIYGRYDVTVHSDHKPLEALFKKPLVSVPARLQRMMMRVQGFDIKVVYTPGKYMYIADTLSRAPLKELMHDRVTDEVETQTCFMIENVPFSELKMEIIRKETKKDSDCLRIIDYVKTGWPKNRYDVHEKLSVFWPYREEFHFINGIIFKGERVFIPRALREEMLSRVHEGHMGIERCKRRAREVMFWPGMCADVERVVRRCEPCAVWAPRPRRQPLVQHHIPSLPWHKLGSDMFEYRRRNYIILVDYFSNFVEVGELKLQNSKQVINFMKEQFARHGIPAELVTDNGPAYSSYEFKNFMRDWEIRQVTSSPLYAQSNGKSERTVQTVKNILKRCIDSGQDFNLGLLNLRATPRDGLDSPAQILMGRRINTKLPISSKLLSEPVNNERNYQALMMHRKKIKQHYDRSARSLERLTPGNRATLIDHGQRKRVSIVARASEPRSFVVKDESGRQFRRSRGQLVMRTSNPVTGMTRSIARTLTGIDSNCQGFSMPKTGPRKPKRKVNRTPIETSVSPLLTATGDSFISASTNTSCGSTPSPSTSSPVVPITRSKERTVRMQLSNLF